MVEASTSSNSTQAKVNYDDPVYQKFKGVLKGAE